MDTVLATAHETIERCRSLAECTEEPGFITRSFLSKPMHEVHSRIARWMKEAGMSVLIDAAGNIRGSYAGMTSIAPRLFIGSHLDTVPRAGAYDGVLGVVLGVALVQLLQKRRLKFQIEVIGFSEEEGLRFGVPFIGSRALIGAIDKDLMDRSDAEGVSISEAIRAFGLDPSGIVLAQAGTDTLGYLEFHIEQGPVLENLGYHVAVVDAIAGQSRLELTFTGQANHAGTTPMHLRHDALAGAAEWVTAVECKTRQVSGLVATVGKMSVEPGASNVIAGRVRVSLDVRHANDTVRLNRTQALLERARAIAVQRGLDVQWKQQLNQPAVVMDPDLSEALKRAVISAGYPGHCILSGAGHDAMIVAQRMPAAMLFLRSPGGVSHRADESVFPEDVAAALSVGLRFMEQMEAAHA